MTGAMITNDIYSLHFQGTTNDLMIQVNNNTLSVL